jgi:hypothetical protein
VFTTLDFPISVVEGKACIGQVRSVYKILVGKPGGENTCDLCVETRMKIKANTVLRK